MTEERDVIHLGNLKGFLLPMRVESFWLPFRGSASQMRDTLRDKDEWAITFV